MAQFNKICEFLTKEEIISILREMIQVEDGGRAITIRKPNDDGTISNESLRIEHTGLTRFESQITDLNGDYTTRSSLS